MADIQNGWFVNGERVIFAIINGSLYQVDAEGTPYAKLPPGEYTNEEAEAAVAEASPKKDKG